MQSEANPGTDFFVFLWGAVKGEIVYQFVKNYHPTVTCRVKDCGEDIPCDTEKLKEHAIAHAQSLKSGLCPTQKIRCPWEGCREEVLPSSMRYHLLTADHLSPIFPCPHCVDYYTRSADLTRHLKAKHQETVGMGNKP